MAAKQETTTAAPAANDAYTGMLAISLTALVVSDARSVPELGSVYPMQKAISPARIWGRKNSFCSCVPKFMIVGPTVLTPEEL